MILRIIVFYILAFFFLVLLGGLQQATGLVPQEISLPQWGPGIAALFMLVIFRADGFKITFSAKDTPISRYLYAALIPLGASLVIFLLVSVLHIELSAGAPNETPLLLMALWMPFGALGEEIGWRGYLHKKLDTRMRGLVSSLIVGLLWLPIHLSFFADGPLILFLLALVIISYSVVIYALVQDTHFNVLLAAVFHLAINLGNLAFLDMLHEPSFMAVNALVWVTTAALTIAARPGLFLSPRQKA